MFKNWSEKKLNRRNIDPDVYNHTHVRESSPILINGYAKKKKYSTTIFLCNEKKYYLLTLNCDPLVIGNGEVGYNKFDNETISNLSTYTGVSSSSNKYPTEKILRLLSRNLKT